jgi:YHS domain-containing protein
VSGHFAPGPGHFIYVSEVMEMKRLLIVLIGSGLVIFTGCRSESPSPTPAPAAVVPAHDNDHAHQPGQHGGIIVSIGRDSYHAEAVFEKGGTLRLYMLDQDETKIMEVEAQTLTAYAKPESETEAEPFELQPQPQPGDTPGKTSLFVGTLPESARGRPVEVTVVNLRVGAERFRVGFKSAVESGHVAMPKGVADDEERELYLTPGGLYTAADIAANGNMTASQKFKGIRASHDDKPQPGDPLCPITSTKANEKFTWVVGGKTYQFCCPPCVDEFLITAKENPAEIKEPEEYMKK